MCRWHRGLVPVRGSVGCERGVPLLVSACVSVGCNAASLATPGPRGRSPLPVIDRQERHGPRVRRRPQPSWTGLVPQTSTRPAQHHGQPGTTPVLTINLSEAIQMSNPPGYDVHHVTKRRSSRCMRCAGSFCCCSGRRQRGGRNRTWYTVQSRSEPQPPGRQPWDARHTAIEMCCLHSTQ